MNGKLEITTWNVNSVRRRLSSISKFLQDYIPDILLLQETKVSNELFPYQFFRDFGYNFIHTEGEKTGYNGVAIIAKKKLEMIPKIEFINDARHLVVKTHNIELHNLYIPAGGDIPDITVNDKFKEKLDFIDNLTRCFKGKKQTDNIIIAGDFNVAPLENDVWSHEQLLKVISHTPIEVEKISNLYNSLNFKDAIRKFINNNEKLYSWWSYRAKDWKKSNRGRRLDHIWTTASLYNKIEKANIFKSTRDHEIPSDHVPVSITLTLD